MPRFQTQSQGGMGTRIDQPAPPAHLAPLMATSPFTGYTPGLGHDELLGSDGTLRPHWRTLSDWFTRLEDGEFARRRDQARRLIRENGVTYNVYGAGHGLDRPWQLDPLPLVLPAAEWTALAAGVAQRARLLDAVLSDVYGPQRLLHDGLLAPAAVFAHPGFLRPCHNVAVPGGRRLHFYAADLIRGPDGRWLVAADRAQAPAGAGYALENRVVLSRALSDAYRETTVQRLAPFFISLRRACAGLAAKLRTPRDNPRIVLLTPGPYNETYFEHAYLARYLGYTLVEGGDLTVRDDQVFLKTLGGLHLVDVILRRLDDDWCDPLELRGDSALGVAGLTAAVRAGNVAVVNALGSGLVENAALLPALPKLCRHLLGEEPLLNAVETLWAGDGLAPIAARLDQLVVRPAFAGIKGDAVAGASLDAAGRERLLARLAASPHGWVAQVPVPPSTVPVWQDGACVPRPLVVRVFAVADGDTSGGNYAVMPGGLARIVDDGRTWAASFQRGGGSKDAWVLAEGPVAPVTLLRPADAPLEFKRGSADLPSRVADNLFWLGRYGARAEDSARLLRAALARLAGDQEAQGEQGMITLLRVLKRLGTLPRPAADTATIEAQLLTLANDADDEGSLLTSLRRLHYAAFASRDRLSNDTWRIVNHLEQDLVGSSPVVRAIEALPRLDRLVIDLAALAGMVTENTTRGPGWRFLDLGRRMERASFTADLLRAALVPRIDEPSLEAVLEVADSAITYRARYLAALQVPAVIDLLLNDATNPRSVAFQLERIADHVANLPRPVGQALPTSAERLAIGAHTWVRLVDPNALSRQDEQGERGDLAHVLDHLSSDLELLSNAITTSHLSHAAIIRQGAPALPTE